MFFIIGEITKSLLAFIFTHLVLPYGTLPIIKDLRNSPAETRYNVLSTADKYITSLAACVYLCPLESEGFITEWAQRHTQALHKLCCV